MFRKTTFAALVLATAVGGAGFALAQAGHDMNMPGMNMPGMAMPGMAMPAQPGDQGPASQAFRAANAAMHEAMAVALTGKVDADFVRQMIPHHQGAIDMARIELEHGTDPVIRKLAEDIIAAQEAEIAMMQAWLAANGG